MKGIKFEKDQIQAVYDEVARRMQQFYTDEYTEREAEEEHRAMRQGVYSVLSSLAKSAAGQTRSKLKKLTSRGCDHESY